VSVGTIPYAQLAKTLLTSMAALASGRRGGDEPQAMV
jgi:hypothetical protein